jgi:hypothetical protein
MNQTALAQDTSLEGAVQQLIRESLPTASRKLLDQVSAEVTPKIEQRIEAVEAATAKAATAESATEQNFA